MHIGTPNWVIHPSSSAFLHPLPCIMHQWAKEFSESRVNCTTFLTRPTFVNYSLGSKVVCASGPLDMKWESNHWSRWPPFWLILVIFGPKIWANRHWVKMILVWCSYQDLSNEITFMRPFWPILDILGLKHPIFWRLAQNMAKQTLELYSRFNSLLVCCSY